MNDGVKLAGAGLVVLGAVLLAFGGWFLALYMAYLMWGIKGFLFTLGLLLAK